jgi:ribosomal protein S18
MAKKPRRARRAVPPDVRRAKKNLFASLGLSAVDYKDTVALGVFISERGTLPVSPSNNNAGHHRDQERPRNGAIALPRTDRQPLKHVVPLDIQRREGIDRMTSRVCDLRETEQDIAR